MTKEFKIIGISIRTTNRDGKSANDMENLWNRFFTEGIAAKVPNKISNIIHVVYTDYLSNYTDEYTAIIGVPVSTLDNIPDGFVGREFKSENFRKFIAKGAMPKAVMETWRDIWQQDKELKRKYTYDFEVYGEKSQNGENSEVEIYIATSRFIT